MSATRNQLSIILTSNCLDRVWAALILAVGAAASGSAVSMYFAFWGLSILRRTDSRNTGKSFLEQLFGRLLPRGLKGLSLSRLNCAGLGSKLLHYRARQKRIPSPEELLTSARQLGVRLVACSMSMDMLGLKRDELIDGIEYGGVATCLADVHRSGATLFI